MDKLFTRPFVLASAAHFLHALSYYFLLALPGYLKQVGATEIGIGLLVGVASAAAIGIRPPLGRIMDTRGRRQVLLVGGGVATLCSAGYFLVTGFGPLVFALRVVHASAEAMLFAALFAFASDIVPESRRIEGIALFGVSGLIPMAIGAALSDVIIQRGGYGPVFLVATISALLGALATLPLVDAPRAPGEPPRGVWASVKQRDLLPLWACGLAFATSLAAPFAFMKTYASAHGNGDVAPYFSAYGVAAALVRVFFGRAPDRLGPKPVLFPSMLAYVAGLLALRLGDGPRVMEISGFLCGVGHGFVFPIILGMVVTRARERERGAALSVFTALFDLGNVIGGPLLGVVARGAGYGAMFVTAAALAAGGLLALVALDRPRALTAR
ncbi:MAG: MFS transporter [Polyangiaceae bacterium]|nr:MFS transporter [Polyangiaceae bacterium]